MHHRRTVLGIYACAVKIPRVFAAVDMDMDVDSISSKRVLAQFKSEEGQLVGAPFDVPVEVTQSSLLVFCNTLLENVSPLWVWGHH